MKSKLVAALAALFFVCSASVALAANTGGTSLTTPPAHSTVNHHRHRHGSNHSLALPKDYYKWAQVAKCESNSSWEILGSAYPDSLGITYANWEIVNKAYHLHLSPQSPTASATIKERIEQIKIADGFLKYYGFSMPDQGGCTGSY